MTSTPNTVRAYLFDPDAATLSTVDLPGSMDDPSRHLTALYDLIGATTVDAVSVQDGLTAFIDDEGLFQTHRALWSLSTIPGVAYVGRAVFVGDREDGEAQPPPITIEDVAALIRLNHAVVVPELVSLEPVAFGDLGAVITATRVGNFTVQLARADVSPQSPPTSQTEHLKEITAIMEAFDSECAAAGQTDTGEAWDILRRLSKIARSAIKTAQPAAVSADARRNQRALRIARAIERRNPNVGALATRLLLINGTAILSDYGVDELEKALSLSGDAP